VLLHKSLAQVTQARIPGLGYQCHVVPFLIVLTARDRQRISPLAAMRLQC
jgi:hypothetical protein